MGKGAVKRPAAKGRAKPRRSGEPKCPKCRRGGRLLGEVAARGCCWSVSLCPPVQESLPHATACGKAGSGVSPLGFLSSVPPLSLQAGGALGGCARGQVGLARKLSPLEAVLGLPQEEVARGGVGLDRWGWIGSGRC